MADQLGKIGVREFKRAVESIQRGEFRKAEKILLQIAAREPRNFNANHMLGIVSTELKARTGREIFQDFAFYQRKISSSVQKLRLFSNQGKAIR
jgi:hypothetical protein